MSEATSVVNLSEAPRDRIDLMTLVSFLIGRREAILRLAGNRSTLWVGFLFVLSAGFAREYDGEDLRAEPWHLLIPLAASVGSSLLLFLLVLAAARLHRTGVRTASQRYFQFLGLYWMTAPLAWVYAIPVERLLSAADSVRANLWLLGLVAVWRVVLIIRVICVVYGARPVSAAILVLTFGDVLVFVLMQTVDVPLLQIMGGVRLNESQQIIASVASTLIVLSAITAPVWLAGTLVVLSRGSQDWQLTVPLPTKGFGVSRGVLAPLAASLAIWTIVLPITQPEQQLRSQVNRLVEQNQLVKAVQLMEAAGPDAFPPHWTPPPQVTRRGIDISLVVTLITQLEQRESPDWLREIYWGKLHDALHQSFSFENYWYQASFEERLALVELLEQQQPERVQELIGTDRPYPQSSYGDGNGSELEQELDGRFNALLEGDSANEATSVEPDSTLSNQGRGDTEDEATESASPEAE